MERASLCQGDLEAQEVGMSKSAECRLLIKEQSLNSN